MTNLFLVTVALVVPAVLLLTSCESGPDAAGAAVGSDTDWVVLFDGSNLDQWRGYKMDQVPDSWTVKDSLIYCSGGGAGDLMTRGEWQNFDLRLEWKISRAGNSGIMYRVKELHGAPYLTGPEYQLLDDQGHPDAGNGADRLAAAAYDLYGPTEDVTRPAGEWNETRIVVDSTRVEHWLNGVKVVEFELFSDDWNQRVADSKWAGEPDFGQMSQGHIDLQDHGDEVWFRNVRLKPLPDTR